MVDEAEKPSSDDMTAGQTKLQSIGTFEDRFEFELDSEESELVTEDLIQTVPPESIQVSQQSSSNRQEKPLSMVESANSLSSAIDSPADRPQSKELSDLDAIYISSSGDEFNS